MACWVTMGARAQQPPPPTTGDSTQPVEILNYTRQLTLKTINDTTKLTIIAGNVKLRQGKTLFYCDSCVVNNNTHLFEAWGKVHVNDSDTTHVTSSHLRYLMRQKQAFLDGGVKLTDGHSTLTTPDLEYNMETNLGIYRNGGKLINGKSVLTSREGWYFSDLKDAYFKKNVHIKDPAYTIDTDSVLFNPESETTRFISFTTIVDSSGRTIKTRDGYVNRKTGKSEFGQRSEMSDGKTTMIADHVETDDSTHLSIATGNVIIRDSSSTLIGGVVYRNTKTNAVLATRKPLLIIKQDNDSIYIAADTLFSARLTDLYFGGDTTLVDSIKRAEFRHIKPEDSTNRYFEGYNHVRIYNDSMQAVCDSVFYSFRDSIFRMYRDPVIWNNENQITGDTILLYTRNKKADKVQAFENSFMVNKLDGQAFNQVQSTRLDGFFTEGNIDSVRVRGAVQCIYYLQDEDSAYTGVNESRCDIMDIYFREKELHRVVFRSSVTGTLWPIQQKPPDKMKLERFRWLDERRPKSRLEMFE